MLYPNTGFYARTMYALQLRIWFVVLYAVCLYMICTHGQRFHDMQILDATAKANQHLRANPQASVTNTNSQQKRLL